MQDTYATKAEIRASAAQSLPAFSGLSLIHLRTNVSEALAHFGRIGIFEEYTKHDMSHVDAMLKLYDWLIPEITEASMTPADWLMLTLSTYLHDFGLLVTRAEFDQRETTGFGIYCARIHESDDPSYKDYHSQLAGMPQDEAERFMYQEFVRSNHAQRIRSWLSESPDPLLGYDEALAFRLRELLYELDETFTEDLGIVCESHHLDDLYDLEKYPCNKPYGSTPQEEANLQYVAVQLRTADLLHITRHRVPSMAALVINPRNPRSYIEWSKQAAVKTVRARREIKLPDSSEAPITDAIEVHATFKDAEGFFALTTYLGYAQKQISQSRGWIEQSQLTACPEYEFPWRRVDTSHIEAKGFETKTFEFTIDQAKILDLLTGHTLYNDTRVVSRELIQNSLDAVRLYAATGVDASYASAIKVKWSSNERILEVQDNGTGMTQRIIVDNFLRVGSSRYQEPDFKKEFPHFTPISRFGIGVLSAFMVADKVSVITCHPDESKARQLTLRDVHGKYLVRLLDKQSEVVPDLIRQHGTSVRLTLRPSARLQDLRETLAHWIVVPGCAVTLQIDGGDEEGIGWTSVAEALANQLAHRRYPIQLDGDNATAPSAGEVRVKASLVGDLQLAYAVRWNHWLQEWNFVQLPIDSSETNMQLGFCVGGIRVTNGSPGYHSGGIAAIANATGHQAPRTNVARTAIELTEEYENALAAIYRVYTQHIIEEMRCHEEERGLPLTRAAEEASYLAYELAAGNVQSHETLLNVLREVPAMVVEQEYVRHRYSLSELSQFEFLSTLESGMVDSFEAVLKSARGASSLGLRRLIEAMGTSLGINFPANPLICSLLPGSFFFDSFDSEWEIFRISTDDEYRVLSADWSRVDGNSRRWIRPSNLITALPGVARLTPRRGRMSLGMYRFASHGAVETALARQALISSGRVLVLEDHEANLLQPASPDIPQGHIKAVAALFLEVLARPAHTSQTRYSPPFEELTRGLIRGSGFQDHFIQRMAEVGVFEVVTEDSLRNMVTTMSSDILDVRKWDRRSQILFG